MGSVRVWIGNDSVMDLNRFRCEEMWVGVDAPCRLRVEASFREHSLRWNSTAVVPWDSTLEHVAQSLRFVSTWSDREALKSGTRAR